MSDGSFPQWLRHAVSWSSGRPGAVGTSVGAVLGLIVVVFSATNTISAQQAIAMAVPAIVVMTVGLVRMVVLDSWAAWRRGFEQGCQAALAYRLRSPNADDSGVSDADSAADPGRLATRLASLRWPPGATG
jgi:hypothetical protein